ncbi:MULTISPECIES: hypothetical protein [unclassified Roseateles]|uniref:hypothetical protein n=1 Tax=unclassified Roseateles TaxID=2626991 RepID=UPI000700CAEE|nr:MULTISPECIES: hypothetical protein [unclassified Roseateles]KQW51208.1 hypothetical protein ASC81_00700 [Pelomonas sp. Root405]KRA77440.1 hypothetical protein ASD88_00700 [Pelomonas sp. Root662]
MDFIDPNEEFHHFGGAEAFIGDLNMNGTSTRYLKLRINTTVIAEPGPTPSHTQWVFIPVADLDRFSAQLAALSESAKRWTPGTTLQSVGENIGVMNTTGQKG